MKAKSTTEVIIRLSRDLSRTVSRACDKRADRLLVRHIDYGRVEAGVRARIQERLASVWNED
jgi:hypothetical protein